MKNQDQNGKFLENNSSNQILHFLKVNKFVMSQI